MQDFPLLLMEGVGTQEMGVGLMNIYVGRLPYIACETSVPSMCHSGVERW